ncbi:BQ5605_C013g07203 [Microbotryum silenes-dioicae]|uniref:BQ5605_C013g07203 protein n=1 Tax=Microbotryum silenes-dioicae TaxID=796604 RepID=A0A2X0NNM3_9BASI|nr:BQ5605_C013g07203 [Microbotryum silenes-dioicae]
MSCWCHIAPVTARRSHRLLKDGRAHGAEHNNLRVMLCEKECRPPIHRDIVAARNMPTVGLQVAAFQQHPFRYPKAGKDEDKQDGKGQQGSKAKGSKPGGKGRNKEREGEAREGGVGEA